MLTIVNCIISGGQTGADRGALDAAIQLGIPHGGTCSRGRKADDGVIHARYKLRESSSADIDVRAEANVSNADGTLLLTFGRLTGNSKAAAELARKHRKPCLHLDLNLEATEDAVRRVREWLAENEVKVLNVGGSREGESAGVYGAVKDLLLRVFG